MSAPRPPAPAPEQASYDLVDDRLRLTIAWPQVTFLLAVALATFLPFALAFALAM